MGKQKVKDVTGTDEVLFVDNRKNGVNGMQHPTADDPMVVCDFDGVGRRWGIEWSRMDGEARQWQEVSMREMRDDLTDEQQRAVENGKIEAHAKINALFLERNAAMARVLVSVPAEWLTDDAPDDFDVTNADHLLDYIKESRSQDLINGVIYARASASKN